MTKELFFYAKRAAKFEIKPKSEPESYRGDEYLDWLIAADNAKDRTVDQRVMEIKYLIIAFLNRYAELPNYNHYPSFFNLFEVMVQENFFEFLSTLDQESHKEIIQFLRRLEGALYQRVLNILHTYDESITIFPILQAASSQASNNQQVTLEQVREDFELTYPDLFINSDEDPTKQPDLDLAILIATQTWIVFSNFKEKTNLQT